MLKSVMRPWCDRCGCARSETRLNGLGSEGLPWRRIRLTRSTKSILPCNDVAREVVKNRRQVEPTPTGHLQVSEVGLPKLVRRRRLVLELVGSLHHDEGRTGDQIVGLEQAIHRGFRHEVALGIGKTHGQFTG